MNYLFRLIAPKRADEACRIRSKLHGVHNLQKDSAKQRIPSLRYLFEEEPTVRRKSLIFQYKAMRWDERPLGDNTAVFTTRLRTKDPLRRMEDRWRLTSKVFFNCLHGNHHQAKDDQLVRAKNKPLPGLSVYRIFAKGVKAYMPPFHTI